MYKNRCFIVVIFVLTIVILVSFVACQGKDGDNSNVESNINSTESQSTNNDNIESINKGGESELITDSSESESSTKEHIHQYNDGDVITKATCNQSGTKKYTCKDSNCGDSYTEEYVLDSYTATELYNESVKYVGEIVTYDRNGNEYALGTGFAISSNGKILTNYHVIEGAYSADITINNKKYAVSSVLAYDADIDLAVLKIDASDLVYANMCKLPVSVGSTVYAIGSSRGMTNTYSQGIITYADRVIDDVSYVQHDASITHGNSGGPLINIYGEVIGINTWGISDSQNLNFAVFADELDGLVYNSPISLEQLNKLNSSPYQALANWIYDNATDVVDGKYTFYDESPDGTLYGITYSSNDGITISQLKISNESTIWSAITLIEDKALADCALIAEWNETGETIGEAYGNLNISTYNYGDDFVYTYFYGNSAMEENIGGLYSLFNRGNIEWLRLLLDTTELEITLINLGFALYEYP